MNIVLKNQIDASEKSAQEIEDKLLHQHRSAILCYDVQDLARSATTLFAEITSDVDRWQRDLARGDSAELAQLGTEWEGLFGRLGHVFEKTARLIHVLEEQQFVVDGKQVFLAAWRELRGITCFNGNAIAAAASQAQRGELTSLGDVERELRDQPHN